jgi:TonB family protein
VLKPLFERMRIQGSDFRAADIKAIANSSVKARTISLRELKSVFLEEMNSLDGVHVEPVFEKRGPAHEAFLREYLGRGDYELQRYYQTLVFSGRGSMPKAVGSDAEVVAYVAKTRGAIGYVSAGVTTQDVKILTIGDAASNAERKLITRVEPEYPDELQKRAIGGTVRLKVTIAADGTVENTELLGGNPVLGDSASAAVARWRYAPAAAQTTREVSIPFDPRH